MNLDGYWIKLSEDAIKYAIDGRKREDYMHMCASSIFSAKKNYRHKIDIFNTLIKEQVIGEANGNLFLIDKDLNFLDQNLAEGDSSAWKIQKSLGSKVKKKKFSDKIQKEIGERGEKYVIDLLNKKFDDSKKLKINHISKFDDTVGYDIETPVYDSDELVHLEVKTTSREGAFTFYLSRNEYEVSQIEYNVWHLVLIRIENNKEKVIGSINPLVLKDIVPTDCDENISRWQSVSIEVQQEWVQPGLPV